MNLLVILFIVGCSLVDHSNGFSCPNGQDGMYTNVNDPHSFWHCANGYAYLKQCPQPLVWSQERQHCDWRVDASTTLTMPTTTIVTTIITTVTTTTVTTLTTTTVTTTTATIPATTPLAKCSRSITFDNIPGAGRFPQPLPNGYSGFQWVNANYLNVSHHEQINGWSGCNAALSSGQYVGLNKDGLTLFMIINAARSFTLKSMIVASVWNDNLILEITGKRGGSVFKSQRVTLQLQPQRIELNWSDLETVNFSPSGGQPNPNVKGKGTQFAFDDLCFEFSK